jgi:Domain of unknown function (DUF4260)
VLLPRQLLRIEGLVVAVGAVGVYFHESYSAWLFIALILAPDVTFAAYAAGPRVGAIAYNAAHSTIAPVALGAACLTTGGGLGVKLALIWLAHIGADRSLGYGLKYPTVFKDTHLQRV